MNPRTSFIRLAVDLDLAGNPIGTHVAIFIDGERDGLTVLEAPAPFDTPQEAFDQALDYAAREYGQLLTVGL